MPWQGEGKGGGRVRVTSTSTTSGVVGFVGAASSDGGGGLELRVVPQLEEPGSWALLLALPSSLCSQVPM